MLDRGALSVDSTACVASRGFLLYSDFFQSAPEPRRREKSAGPLPLAGSVPASQDPLARRTISPTTPEPTEKNQNVTKVNKKPLEATVQTATEPLGLISC